MKSSLLMRGIICLVPVLLSAWIVAAAYSRYQAGEGGFKLGVDLSGGSILVYEIDLDKFPDGKPPPQYRPEQLVNALKRRIDPADLYSITIRPLGETRVELILPTGGKHQIEVEDEKWQKLLLQVKEEWPAANPKEAWDKLLEALKKHELDPGTDVGEGKLLALADAIRAKHPDKKLLEIYESINQNYEPKLNVGRGQVAGLVVALAEANPEAAKKTEKSSSGGEITFSDQAEKFINEHYKATRSLTPSDIANVKELISRVGSLEFRILANNSDDANAIAAAKAQIADPANKDTLEKLNRGGKAPPPPRNAEGGESFETNNIAGPFTYGWVEVGKSYRKDLGLDNASRNGQVWKMAEEARKKGETFSYGDNLYYSRKVENPSRLAEKDRDKQYEYFVLTRNPVPGKEITGQYLTNAFETTDRSQRLAIGFRFNQAGGDLFYELTGQNAPKTSQGGSVVRQLAIILDQMIESAPSLRARISTDGIIEGRFSPDDVSRMVNILRAGALPATLKPAPVSENTIGPTLGADTIKWGAYSVVGAFFAVMVFMCWYYRFAGMVASVALLANLLLTVGFMVLVNATFTLPGLAGIVLMLGMAVDANVLIYERLREERDRGASLALALRNGYDRAFPTIIDTHLSSIFTAIVLYVVGNDQLKGFGVSLTVGLVISLFTSLYMTRFLFDLWSARGWLTQLTMLRMFARPNIDFMAVRYQFFTITVVLTVLGAGLFVARLNRSGTTATGTGHDSGILNIDFVGGTAYGGQLNKPMDIEELRHVLKDSSLPDMSIEQVFVSTPGFTEGNKSKLFTVRTSERDQVKVQDEIVKLLGDKLQRIEIGSYAVATDNKRATLKFIDRAIEGEDKTAYASRGQVGMILAQAFKDKDLESLGNQFTLEGEGQEREGRYPEMRLDLPTPLDKATFDGVLAALQEKFKNSPQPERLENFDKQLAADMQQRALYAILASWGAILLYLWFRFGNWTFGLAAVFCLIHDLFFTLGIIAGCYYIHEWMPGLATALLIQPFKIDLPAVAALLTLVGYSVNDTIVVFDRIREVRGKNPELTSKMINDSVNQTLSRTLLASLTTWLVVIVLYIFGGEGVHLFAFVMVVGVVIGTYSSIYVASPLLLMFGEGRPAARVGQPAGTAG